jgi:hypothetical protein
VKINTCFSLHITGDAANTKSIALRNGKNTREKNFALTMFNTACLVTEGGQKQRGFFTVDRHWLYVTRWEISAFSLPFSVLF